MSKTKRCGIQSETTFVKLMRDRTVSTESN